MSTITYDVSGMTCGGCAKGLTRALASALPAVTAEVDHAAGTVRLTGEHTESAVQQAVSAAGFQFGGPHKQAPAAP